VQLQSSILQFSNLLGHLGNLLLPNIIPIQKSTIRHKIGYSSICHSCEVRKSDSQYSKNLIMENLIKNFSFEFH
jgi:hypothetical protein